MNPTRPTPAPAPFALPLALAALAALMTACGGGGVSVPDGVTTSPSPSPSPSPTPDTSPSPSPAIDRVSASCVDPTPSVTETAVFDTTETTGITGTGTRVSANKSTVCFTTSTTGAVRSTVAVAQGGFQYFEATRSNSVSIGVGTATAPMVPTGATTDNIASTDQSIVITDGSVYTKGAFIPSFNVGAETKFGFAIDYRGPHPIVYVLGSTAIGSTVSSAAGNCPAPGDATTPCVYGRHVLGSVTTPVYIYASGNNSNAAQTGTVSINTGGSFASKPFTYSATKVRQAVRAVAFKGEVGLNTEWAATGTTSLPTITVAGSRTRSVLQVGDGTPYTGSDTFSVTTSGTSVQWLTDTGALIASGLTLTLTDSTVQSVIGLGTHRIQALATDSATGKISGLDFKVTYTNTDSDDDGDGRTYAQEKAATPPTDPSNPDTDGDGIADGVVGVTATAGQKVVLKRELSTVSGLATSQGVILDDDQLSVVLNSDLNPDCIDGTLPADGNYGAQPLDTEQCKKRAIRASVGISQGEFRYFETRRAASSGISGFNMGQGIITRTGKVDPFCCTATGTPDARTPPSFMANSADGFWDTLVSIGSFSTAQTEVIGFAVDYTGATPIVHAITANSTVGGAPVVFTRTLTSFTGNGEAVPFVYGHPYSSTEPAIEINFGLKAFTYDARTVLSNAGVTNASSMELGVGYHKRP